MSWNYRMINKDGELAIYSVYYYDDGSIQGTSLNPDYPIGYDNIEDLREELERYSSALEKPILKYDDIVKKES